MKYTVLGLLVLFASCSSTKTEKDKPDPSYIFAIGSCNRTTMAQVMWEPITSNHPDVFIWLGDIVYGDTHDMRVLQSKYDALANEPGYQKLISGTKDVIGVWDDHDYGWNDAGKYYNKKDSSKQILVDFLKLDEDDPVRSRQGLYSSYEYGQAPLLTQVILLDARYFRDTVISSPDPSVRYTINPDGDVLGEEQWQWLEKELTESKAEIHIIGSGIQVLPEEHGWEKWANFPKSRERLLNLIAAARPKNPLLVSGDRHIAEFSKIELDDGYVLYEMTSSGLTHTWSQLWEEPNKYRVGDIIAKKNFGLIKLHTDRMVLEVRGEQDSLFKSLDIPLN
jgi:alkaline phosphatase D